MFRVTINGHLYEVRFSHGGPGLFSRPEGGEYATRTWCGIYLYTGEVMAFQAEGKKHFLRPGAPKAQGRKIALARALAQMGFSKEVRAEFWRAYFKRSPVRVKMPCRDKNIIAALITENEELRSHFTAMFEVLNVMVEPACEAEPEVK